MMFFLFAKFAIVCACAAGLKIQKNKKSLTKFGKNRPKIQSENIKFKKFKNIVNANQKNNGIKHSTKKNIKI